MSQRKMRNYDKEFKLSAVKLYLGGDRSYRHLSKELGVPEGTLAGWVIDYKKEGHEAFPGKGQVKESEAEVLRLRKELAIAQEERDILKKALGIFSSQKR